MRFFTLAHSVDGSIHLHLQRLAARRERSLASSAKQYTELKNLCVWAKPNAGMGSFYRSQHELVFVFKTVRINTETTYSLGEMAEIEQTSGSHPAANHFGRSGDEGNILHAHPTPKPVKMVADAILDCTAPGDIVLDPFLGSGSTLIAAERVARACRGVEIDPGLYRRCDQLLLAKLHRCRCGSRRASNMSFNDRSDRG